MASQRSVWLRRILYVLGGLAVTYVCCGLGSFTVIYWMRGRAPDDVKAVVEPRLETIRRFTESSAARCSEVRGMGLLARLQGTVPASPAAGAELDRWPELVDVRVRCMWYEGADRSAATGNEFLPLRDVSRAPDRSSEGEWEVTRTFFPGREESNEERVIWWREEPGLVDVKVSRPLPGGDGYITVEVTLRRTP